MLGPESDQVGQVEFVGAGVGQGIAGNVQGEALQRVGRVAVLDAVEAGEDAVLGAAGHPQIE